MRAFHLRLSGRFLLWLIYFISLLWLFSVFIFRYVVPVTFCTWYPFFVFYFFFFFVNLMIVFRCPDSYKRRRLQLRHEQQHKKTATIFKLWMPFFLPFFWSCLPSCIGHEGTWVERKAYQVGTPIECILGIGL